jgi:hypothetical protein
MEGGSDTSGWIIIAFAQAMTRWPDVQKRAQQESDAAVGEDRSPAREDYEKLAYVAACQRVSAMEAGRPFGIPACFGGGYSPFNSCLFILRPG